MTMTVEEAVQSGAEIFAEAEQKAKAIRHSFRTLGPVFEAVHNAGLIGGLEATALATRCDALATQFVADVYAIHAELTERAKAANIDLPATESGGGR